MEELRLEDTDDEFKRLICELTERHNDFKRLQDDIKTKDKKLERLQEELIDKDEDIERFKDDVKTNNEEVEILKQQLNDKENEVEREKTLWLEQKDELQGLYLYYKKENAEQTQSMELQQLKYESLLSKFNKIDEERSQLALRLEKMEEDIKHSNIDPSIANTVDIKHEVDTDWAIGSEEYIADDTELYKKTRSILGRLTTQNFNKLVTQLKKLPIETEKRMQGVANIFVETAIIDMRFSVVYANAARCMSTLTVPSTSKPDTNVNFRAVLLARCQREFEGMLKILDSNPKTAGLNCKANPNQQFYLGQPRQPFPSQPNTQQGMIVSNMPQIMTMHNPQGQYGGQQQIIVSPNMPSMLPQQRLPTPPFNPYIYSSIQGMYQSIAPQQKQIPGPQYYNTTLYYGANAQGRLSSTQSQVGPSWTSSVVSQTNDSSAKSTPSGEAEMSNDDENKANARRLGLVRLIGELFNLQMLTENIMHDTVFKLLTLRLSVALCVLLTTIGKKLDTDKAKTKMDQYFQSMTKLSLDKNRSNKERYSLLDVIELRERKWVPR